MEENKYSAPKFSESMRELTTYLGIFEIKQKWRQSDTTSNTSLNIGKKQSILEVVLENTESETEEKRLK